MSNAARRFDTEAPGPMTVAEFQAWPGDGSGGRFQLVDGEIRAMSPATTTHATIQNTLARVIGNHLDVPGSQCRSLVEPAVAVRIRTQINQRVPDVGVTCTPDAPGEVEIPDPILLIEVLSPGNRRATWDNVWAYTTIPSVKEILIVSSFEIAAEVLRRQADGSWPAESDKLGRDGVLHLQSIGLTLPLAAIFARTYLARSE